MINKKNPQTKKDTQTASYGAFRLICDHSENLNNVVYSMKLFGIYKGRMGRGGALTKLL